VGTRTAFLGWFAGSLRSDAALAAGLCVLAEIDLQGEARQGVGAGGRVVLGLLAAAATLPLAWRRRAPLAVFAAVLVPLQITGLLVNGLALVPPATQGPVAFIVAGVVAAFSCSAHGGLRSAAIGYGLLALAFLLVALPKMLAGARLDLGLYVALAIFLAVGWLFYGR
jgi:hypothetical protein